MPRVGVFLVLILSSWLLVPVGAQQAPPYRILISNDDGVRAPGLAAVAQILQAIGQVIIVGPSENQSGKGHSIVTSEPILREDLTLPNGLKAIGLTATPATTVNVAIRNILKPLPDLVVSGINRGYNLGYTAVHLGHGGCCARSRDAWCASHRGLARRGRRGPELRGRRRGSARRRAAGEAVRPAAEHVPQREHSSYAPGRVSTATASPHRPCRRAGEERFAEMAHPSGRTVYWNVYKEGGTGPEGTDIRAVNEGYVSVTPMKLGEADASQFEALRAIFK